MRIVLLALALWLVAAIGAVAQSPPVAAKPHVSRSGAIELLRREGILSGRWRVASAVWHADLQEWLVVLRYPRGSRSWWFVDAAGQNYQGGTCTQ